MCQEKEEEEGSDSMDTSIRWLDDHQKKKKKRRTKITKKQKWEEKQLYRYFERQTDEISLEKSWTWLRKGNLKKEAESLLIAAQNNSIWINYVEAKIDKT